MKRPLLGYGANHVDLGGMSFPASATAKNSSSELVLKMPQNAKYQYGAKNNQNIYILYHFWLLFALYIDILIVLRQKKSLKRWKMRR